MPDVQSTVLQYGKTPVNVRLTLATETPEMTRIMGSHGVVEVSNNSVTLIPQARHQHQRQLLFAELSRRVARRI